MSERSDSGEKTSDTLLGLPAPRVDDSAASAARKPVFIRSGTSVVDADNEPPPLPRMALPSRPPAADVPWSDKQSEAPMALSASLRPSVGGLREFARRHPGVWMAGAPALIAGLVVGALGITSPKGKPTARSAPLAASSAGQGVSSPPPPVALLDKKVDVSALADKPLAALNADELVRLSAAKAERRRDAVLALRQKLSDSPTLLSSKPVQADLLEMARDAETAREALAAMAQDKTATGADLLYEVWTGTVAKTEATELARALVYSSDVRPSASAALTVALDLRQAETCEQFKVALPKALKDGDRRSLPPLMKLGSRRGCGPKKAQDCFACLRSSPEEITATINAVKSRRGPQFSTR